MDPVTSAHSATPLGPQPIREAVSTPLPLPLPAAQRGTRAGIGEGRAGTSSAATFSCPGSGGSPHVACQENWGSGAAFGIPASAYAPAAGAPADAAMLPCIYLRHARYSRTVLRIVEHEYFVEIMWGPGPVPCARFIPSRPLLISICTPPPRPCLPRQRLGNVAPGPPSGSF